MPRRCHLTSIVRLVFGAIVFSAAYLNKGETVSHLKIAHLSDLHVRRDYRGTMLEDEIHQPIFPPAYVEIGLKRAAKERPDVLVLTGDLVHEGTVDDYRFLRELINRCIPGIPVIPALGNHDCKEAFYRGFLDESRQGPLTDVRQIGGYRFITLDTATENVVDGSISEEQFEWLQDVLKEPSPNGSILLGHHPFRSQQSSWFSTSLPEGFLNYLQGTDVIAYLCGHAHFLETRTLGHILQLTGESFEYGVETQEESSLVEVVYTETRAFNMIWLDNREITAHAHFVFPFNPVIERQNVSNFLKSWERPSRS